MQVSIVKWQNIPRGGSFFFIDDAALKRYVRSAWGGEAEPDARGRDGVLFYVSFLPSSVFSFFFFFPFAFLP